MDPLDNTNAQPVENEPNNSSFEEQKNLNNQQLEKANPQTQAARQEKPLTTPTQAQPVQSPNRISTAQSQVGQQFANPAPVEPPTPSTTPSIPGDDDKLDTQYINRAEHIIEENKDDPYTEDEQEEGLSQEFLNKKYGLNIDKSKE